MKDVDKPTPEMIESGVKALRGVLGAHDDSRSTLVEYDEEDVVAVYERMRSLETAAGLHPPIGSGGYCQGNLGAGAFRV